MTGCLSSCLPSFASYCLLALYQMDIWCKSKRFMYGRLSYMGSPKLSMLWWLTKNSDTTDFRATENTVFVLETHSFLKEKKIPWPVKLSLALMSVATFTLTKLSVKSQLCLECGAWIIQCTNMMRSRHSFILTSEGNWPITGTDSGDLRTVCRAWWVVMISIKTWMNHAAEKPPQRERA